MKQYNVPLDGHEIGDGLDRLIEDLKKLNLSESEVSEHESNSLSLMVDEALKGVDIRSHYPTFYTRLLKSFALRQQFIEAILLLKQPALPEAESLFAVTHADLAFLHSPSPAPHMGETQWHVILQQTKEQLMSVFFPPRVVFRAGAAALADAHYTLLRSEFAVNQTLYTLLLESTLHENRADALALFLNVAVSDGSLRPMHASLHWGGYAAEATLSAEGRTRLPDLPISAAFDVDQQQIQADLNLTLTSAA